MADPTRLRQISERIPAGRWGDPKDFAGPVVFLASKASQYVCGELLVVDGVSLISSSYIYTSSIIDPMFQFSRTPHRVGWAGRRSSHRKKKMKEFQTGRITES